MTSTEKSQEVGAALREFIGSTEMSFPDGHKDILVMGYFSLALEHHHSISLLITHKKIGSAFALMRPLVEIVFRAHWVVGCATQPQIDQIHQGDEFRFPGFGQMADDIETVFKANSLFSKWKENAWGPLNSY